MFSGNLAVNEQVNVSKKQQSSRWDRLFNMDIVQIALIRPADNKGTSFQLPLRTTFTWVIFRIKLYPDFFQSVNPGMAMGRMKSSITLWLAFWMCSLKVLMLWCSK